MAESGEAARRRSARAARAAASRVQAVAGRARGARPARRRGTPRGACRAAASARRTGESCRRARCRAAAATPGAAAARATGTAGRRARAGPGPARGRCPPPSPRGAAASSTGVVQAPAAVRSRTTYVPASMSPSRLPRRFDSEAMIATLPSSARSRRSRGGRGPAPGASGSGRRRRGRRAAPSRTCRASGRGSASRRSTGMPTITSTEPTSETAAPRASSEMSRIGPSETEITIAANVITTQSSSSASPRVRNDAGRRSRTTASPVTRSSVIPRSSGSGRLTRRA